MTSLAEPFDSPVMVALDVGRLVLATAGLFLAGYQVRMVQLSQTRGQKCRFLAVGLALLVLAGSRLQNLGDTLTWQAVVMVVVVALFGYGTWQFARHETPTQPRGEAQPPGRHGAGA